MSSSDTQNPNGGTRFDPVEYAKAAAENVAAGRDALHGGAGAEVAFVGFDGSGQKVLMLDLDLIDVDESQVRRKRNERVGLDELKSIIARYGFQSAVVVMRHGARFRLVSGKRRYLAAKDLGLTQVPAILLGALDELSRLGVQVTENTKRKDISPIELSDALLEACGGGNVTQAQAGQALGISDAARVSRLMSIAKLPEEVKDKLDARSLSEAHCLSLASLHTVQCEKSVKPENALAKLLGFIDHVVDDGWSVKYLREQCDRERKRLGGGPRKKAANKGAEGAKEAPTTTDAESGAAVAAAPEVLFTKSEQALVVNLEYLAAGRATAEEKAGLHRVLEELLQVMAKAR